MAAQQIHFPHATLAEGPLDHKVIQQFLPVRPLALCQTRWQFGTFRIATVDLSPGIPRISRDNVGHARFGGRDLR
jgi:hypothetical protein